MEANVEERHGSAGAFRAVGGGAWGVISGPHMEANVEERHGSAGAFRAVGGAWGAISGPPT